MSDSTLNIPVSQLPVDSAFGKLGKDAVDFLFESGRRKSFRKGDVIFLESDSADFFYVVLKGRIRISRLNREGKEVVIAIFGPGNFFGEMGILDGLTRSTDATSEEHVELLVVRAEYLFNMLTRFPEAATEMLCELALRIRNSDSQIKGLSILNAHGKVASALLRWAQDHGKHDDAGRVIISGMPTQREMASYVGLTRETFNRLLMKLQSEGRLEVRHGGTIILNNYEEFRKIYGPFF